MAFSVVSSKKKSWLDYQHPEFVALAPRWAYATAHYSGEVVDPSKVQDFLVRRQQAETTGAFLERAQLADFVPYFAHVVDSMAGMMFAVEDQATRTFNPQGRVTLGDPADGATIMGKLWHDADGKGNGWLTIFKQLTVELEVNHTAWVFVDPANGTPRIRMLPAGCVPNHLEDPVTGHTTEVLVQEQMDQRGSLKDDTARADSYLYLTTTGWQRFTKDKDGKPVAGASGTWAFFTRDGQPSLPIFQVKLPLARQVGWLLAKRNNVLFNKESERDHILRVANFPRLNLVADDVLYKKLVQALAKGSNALQAVPGVSAHHYIAPSSEPARVASDVLKHKIETFYVTSFREYGSSAQSAERTTATQVKQDVSSGIGAFLEMLAGALDDAENKALWLIEQAQFSKDKQAWFHARVARSRDFSPFDVNAEIDRLSKRYFGDSSNPALPVGAETRLAALKQIAIWDGLPFDADCAREAMQLADMSRTQQLLPQLTPGPKAKGALTTAYLRAMGFILEAEPTESVVKGTDALQLDLLSTLAESVTTAQQHEDNANMMAQGPTGPGGF